jgi:hypothetical protein
MDASHIQQIQFWATTALLVGGVIPGGAVMQLFGDSWTAAKPLVFRAVLLYGLCGLYAAAIINAAYLVPGGMEATFMWFVAVMCVGSMVVGSIRIWWLARRKKHSRA